MTGQSIQIGESSGIYQDGVPKTNFSDSGVAIK